MYEIFDIKSKLFGIPRKIVSQVNYMLDNYEEVVWLAGDGRSGTTWVSSLLNHDKRYREIFEPFHPKFVRNARFLLPHQYARANELDNRTKAFASNVFSGKFSNSRVDSGNWGFTYQGLLVKDIFANLLLYPLSLQFPKVKPVLLIRNPFAVAVSKYNKRNWFWATDPLDLLNQEHLYQDYLQPFEALIRETSAKGDFILNQILTWSIINYIPLRQFKADDIHICFYENIYAEPNVEASNILRFVREESDSYQIDLPGSVISKPSRFTGEGSSLQTDASPVLSWQNELDTQTIDKGLELLEHFGFDNLYDDFSMPKRAVIEKFQPIECR